ncbi:50S ribosomal protein L25 [Candidatus Uhrbacteria bacterium]|nr:50S ribosomal protein L25 [Candidatus Uhrbacteria bacterium]
MTVLTAKTRKPNEKIPAVEGKEPLKAVVYGNNIPSVPLFIDPSDFLHLYREVKYNSLFDLVVDDAEPVKALIQDIQVHPVSMKPIHVDFRQIRMDQPITVNIPLVFEGESDAVKMGGTLIKNLDEVEIECLPAKLPKELVVDLTALATYDDRIEVGSLKVPEGVTINQEKDELIATVEEPLSEEELKKLEEQEIGDVSEVQTEGEEKKEGEEEAKEEGSAESGEDKKEE